MTAVTGLGASAGDREAKPSIAVLMSNADDARQRKLVGALRRHGYPTTVLAFSRPDYYRAHTDDITVLGVLAHESYLTRVRVYLGALPRLRRNLGGADVAMVFSSEHVLLVRLATALSKSTLRVVREFGDVPRTVDGSGWIPALARSIERWGLRLSSAVMVTAEGFIESYLRSRMGYSGPVTMLPNKSDLPYRPDSEWIAPEEAGRLEILYPGLLRCRRSVDILLAVAEAAPDQISVTVCGHNLTGREITERENFRFLGSFRSPEDLDLLYGGCHVVYSGYPYEPTRSNYALARTIRFHDSVIFGRPQIAHEGTADGTVVATEELGIAIDPSDVDDAVRRIASVSVEAWQQYAANARRLAHEWTTYDEDFAAVVAELGLMNTAAD
jgi:succinoglycan biosynthesis protein ExoL